MTLNSFTPPAKRESPSNHSSYLIYFNIPIKFQYKQKLIEFKFSLQVLGILCMALASPALVGGTHWFLFVAVTSFIATVLWSFVYLLGIREVLNLPINWVLTVSL